MAACWNGQLFWLGNKKGAMYGIFYEKAAGNQNAGFLHLRGKNHYKE
jgi:hypothetical protein